MRRIRFQLPAIAVPRLFGRGRASVAAGRSASFRRVLGVFAFAVVAGFAHADDLPVVEQETAANLPAFLFEPLHASNEGSVYGIYEARQADLILVKGGFDSGFQSGMVCRVTGEESEVGEIMLVDVRKNCSAGLILQLEPGNVIEPGHSVRIKTVTF